MRVLQTRIRSSQFQPLNQLFHIFQVTTADVQKIASAPNNPHQHDYEELIVGIEGQIEHFIDFKTTVITAPFVSFVTKGKTHRVAPDTTDGQCNMWVLRFKSEFIPETTFQLYSNYH